MVGALRIGWLVHWVELISGVALSMRRKMTLRWYVSGRGV